MLGLPRRLSRHHHNPFLVQNQRPTLLAMVSPPIPPFDTGGSGGDLQGHTACPKRSPEHALVPLIGRFDKRDTQHPTTEHPD